MKCKFSKYTYVVLYAIYEPHSALQECGKSLYIYFLFVFRLLKLGNIYFHSAPGASFLTSEAEF
jgi:hypothetical protein